MQPQLSFPPLTPAVKRLLIVLAAIFLGQLVVASAMGASAQTEMPAWVGLHIDNVLRGRVWQPLTYMFVHSLDGWGHLLSNAMALYFFGTAVETSMGSKALYKIALGGGLLGGVFSLVAQVLGEATGLWTTGPVVGASGAISGILGAFCWMNWDRWIYLFFLRLKGRHFLLLIIAIDAIRVLGPSNVAVECHMGGLAFGILWVTGWIRPRHAWLSFRHWQMKRKLKVVHSRDPDERGPYLN